MPTSSTTDKLWEILVPTVMDRGQGPVPIRKRYHRVWDRKIRDMSGGLTILSPTKGQWVSPSSELVEERMIPIRIMCTRDQIEEIADFTLEYYNQEAVMFYLVSTAAEIRYRTP